MSNRFLFYVDKDCFKKFCEKIEDIFMKNQFPAASIYVGTGESKKPGKKWLSYSIDDYQSKANTIVRSFDWESIGVTGFEEIKEIKENNPDLHIVN